MTVVNALVSAVAQLLVLAGIPIFAYAAYHRIRHKRGWADIARRAGLSPCPVRYASYGIAFGLASVVCVLVWSPPLELVAGQGSPLAQFVGLGLGATAWAMALLYGVIQTGLTEEILFRGLIAGSLARRFPLAWANLAQAFIFFLPHLLILYVMPEAWNVLPIVFVGALVFGWLRIKSGSVIAPWLVHASANVAMALSVAARSAT